MKQKKKHQLDFKSNTTFQKEKKRTANETPSPPQPSRSLLHKTTKPHQIYIKEDQIFFQPKNQNPINNTSPTFLTQPNTTNQNNQQKTQYPLHRI